MKVVRLIIYEGDAETLRREFVRMQPDGERSWDRSHSPMRMNIYTLPTGILRRTWMFLKALVS